MRNGCNAGQRRRTAQPGMLERIGARIEVRIGVRIDPCLGCQPSKTDEKALLAPGQSRNCTTGCSRDRILWLWPDRVLHRHGAVLRGLDARGSQNNS